MEAGIAGSAFHAKSQHWLKLSSLEQNKKKFKSSKETLSLVHSYEYKHGCWVNWDTRKTILSFQINTVKYTKRTRETLKKKKKKLKSTKYTKVVRYIKAEVREKCVIVPALIKKR